MTATTDNARLMRTRRIKAIKAAERQLGLEQPEHVVMVREFAGCDSLTQCTLPQLNAILSHLNERTGGGFKGKPERHRPGTGAQLEKIEAQLADMKLPWPYALAILKRVSSERGQPGVDRWEWAKPEHLAKVIAALDYEQRRRWGEEAVTYALKAAGLSADDLPRLVRAHGIPWDEKWARKPATANLYRQAIAHETEATP